MILCEFSMSPLGKGESVSPYVSRVLRIVDSSGLPYVLHPMGTVVEGEWDEITSLLTECYKELERDCDRISVSVKIDSRKGPGGRLEKKVATVEDALGKKLGRVERS